MTPQREKYLAKCSERELDLRKEISEIKGVLVAFKWKLNSKDSFYFSNPKAILSIYKSIRRLKYQLTAYRHELARLKGMDRVVVPKEIRYRVYDKYGKCSCGVWVYSKCDFCPKCGRRILWKKVK